MVEKLHNVDAEQAILGSLIIDPDCYHPIATIIDTDDFFIKRNAWIFQAIGQLHRNRKSVDYLTVSDELEKHDQLEKAGGTAYLVELTNRVPSALHAEDYAEIIRELAYQRRLENAASEIAKVAYKDVPLDERRVLAREAFDGAEKTRIRPNALSADKAADILFEQAGQWAENPLEEDEVRGISTGLVDLDRMLDGLVPGLYLIGAVQHTGKTALCQQIVMNVAQAGGYALFFSMEHSAEYMYQRMASALSQIAVRDIRHGLDSYQLVRYHKALSKIEEWKVEIIGRQLSLVQIEAEVRSRLHRDLDLVVVDNLEQASSSVNVAKEYVQLRRAAYELLAVAQDDNIALPILTTMQVGTKMAAGRDGRRPRMEDLYGSDGPCQAATVVLLLHRDDRWTFKDSEKTNVMEIAIHKDKANFTGTGKGGKFVFGAQGQVWDMAKEDDSCFRPGEKRE